MTLNVWQKNVKKSDEKQSCKTKKYYHNHHCYLQQKRQYCVYSGGDFEGFRPAGVTRSTDYCEIWHSGGDPDLPSAVPNFTLIGPYLGVSGPKGKHKNREICKLSRPAEAAPLHSFSEIYSVYAWFPSV